MFKRLIAIVMFCVLPYLSAQASEESSVAQREDAPVLRAVLQSQCQSNNGYVILSSKAVAPGAAADIGGADESGAFDDLKRRNMSAVSLPGGLSCRGVQLREDKEIQAFSEPLHEVAGKISLGEGWKKMHESLPGATGWMSVSLPGYAPSRDVAVVYVVLHCGSLCGQGAYVYLHRINGQWKALVRFPVWVT
ncbi:hypothetical protein SAMN05216570_0141 [Dyella sp. OK004]|uniref:hypothetical protein n=1 Tax=Dyella sp. OK004 TaxID=1855292 RepID=UPI0008F09EA7|nr:hypothetical protein [Dyella sp. OK004]SFR86832.1 hypothetical protein SAMN05216570_0141 [Dyella sp. OK004]